MKENLTEAERGALSPSYYNKESMSVCDIIDAYDLNFYRGNIVKYILRSGKKDPDAEIQDLQKAMTYCKIEIDRLHKKQSSR